nr:pro-resilin-like isoform X3 [Penaeus vannamei]
MNTKILILLGLAAVVVADRPQTSYGHPRDSSEESFESFESFESGEAKYDFSYAVKHEDSGNDFGHQEARDGEDTQGSYYVRLPDTRLQNVKYFVDGDDGYVAEVNYEGEARFPDSSESASFESREYRPPRPAYTYDSDESK